MRACRPATLVLCASTLVASCTAAPRPAARPAAPPPPAAPAVPKVAYTVDFSRVFGGHGSTSLYDFRVVDVGLMARVMVEPELLNNADNKLLEPWTRRRLLEALGDKGALLVAPPLVPAQDPRQPCPTGGCFQPPPTAVLRNVRFVSSKDAVAVRVLPPQGDVVTVTLWDVPGPPSVCGEDFKLTVGFVELQGVVHRLADGAIAGYLEELALVDAPNPAQLTVRAPEALRDPAAFCGVLRIAFETQKDFAFSDQRYDTAAHTVLNAALAPLFPKPQAPVPPR